jgi:hypothetical protein
VPLLALPGAAAILGAIEPLIKYLKPILEWSPSRV